jgi:hypothetical protein
MTGKQVWSSVVVVGVVLGVMTNAEHWIGKAFKIIPHTHQVKRAGFMLILTK